MTYKNAFSVADKKQNDETNKFQLKNYDIYEPKLEDDFYLKYFLYQVLFEVDILQLKECLEYHYNYCDDPDSYFQIIDLKVIPKIKDIIDNSEVNLIESGYYDEIPLEDDFVETEGVVKKWKFDYPQMYHLAAIQNLQSDFEKRVDVIQKFVNDYEDNSEAKPLEWIAGPSQLAIIIRELIDNGYMTSDFTRGEINNSKLAKNLFKTFNMKNCDSSKGIEIYLSPNNKRYKQAKAKFDDAEFFIPPVKQT